MTHYDTLGVTPESPDAVIKASFRVLSRAHHPDVSDTGDPELYARITEAYDTLGDPVKRAEYDRTLAAPAAAEDDEPEGEETWGEETSYDEYADARVEEPADEMDTADAATEAHRPSPIALGALAVVGVLATAGIILAVVEGGAQWGWLAIFAAVAFVVWRTRASIPAIATACIVIALAWCVRSSGALSVAADLTLWALPIAAAVAARLTKERVT